MRRMSVCEGRRRVTDAFASSSEGAGGRERVGSARRRLRSPSATSICSNAPCSFCVRDSKRHTVVQRPDGALRTPSRKEEGGEKQESGRKRKFRRSNELLISGKRRRDE